ncbi:barstar family protein [Robbsia sp. Bb-Pol-6]|uniref:Barstar family protein n=1 Tax=Robbsia betulipollinis TaxID=2981849 RepID=A0ABT3ZQS1_9BURK|nr:barstar family protein [Robbsia betulipollinis]MCY0388885.1 barstar family protein [Robbsia betulipollinis]
MSGNHSAHDTVVAGDLFGRSDVNLFRRVLSLRDNAPERKQPAPCAPEEAVINIFKTVRPNIVQSIRAFRVVDLAAEAQRLGQHFLYANCAAAMTKGEVLETISSAFFFPKHFGKNFDALYDSLTDLVAKSGEQPGFVVVLDSLPAVQKFDKEARENLLDVFREAAEFWAERRVTFRVFYSFL